MTYTFRTARRSEAKPLIGLYSESGCGKTWSSLLLARGFCGPDGRIGMIETEGGRGEAYVGRHPVADYLVCPIRDNFSPMAYGEAISAAEAAKLDVLIVDSASHEWEGAGGVLSMAADNQANGVKGVLVWQKPKIEHQRNFMLRLMQTPIPLVIVCMRAKYPMVQVPGRSEWSRSTQLEPKQADDILFEMMIHGWIDQAHKMQVTKYTLPELEDVMPSGAPITLQTGEALAKWAKGESFDDFRKTAAEWDHDLAEAAKQGIEKLQACWSEVPKKFKTELKPYLESKHKPNAQKVEPA
jgi:hypothetical protein